MERLVLSEKGIDFENIFASFEKDILSKVKNLIKVEKDVLEFEIAYGTMISEDNNKKTDKLVSEMRKKDWNEALDKSKGDKDKAISIFSSCENF